MPAAGRVPEDGLPFADEESWADADTQPASAPSLLGGLSGDERAPLRIESIWVPQHPIQASTDELGYLANRVRLGAPLGIYEDGIWLMLGGVQWTQFETSFALPDSQMAFPSSLWNIDLGTMRIWNAESGTQYGALLKVGSASDQPFASIHEMTLTSLAFATVPYGPRDAWNFSLFYSPTSQMNFPVPGIAYVWRPSPQLQANVGIPASLDYRPTDTFTLTARYTPVTNVFVEARQYVSEDWSLFARYEIVNETFWLADRQVEHDRFFAFDQRFAGGLSRELGKGFRLDATLLYLFDRRYFQAESFSDDRHDVVELSSGMAGALQLLWRR